MFVGVPGPMVPSVWLQQGLVLSVPESVCLRMSVGVPGPKVPTVWLQQGSVLSDLESEG